MRPRRPWPLIRKSLLHELAAQNGVEGKTVFQAAEAGDETALMVCQTYVRFLADGVISLVNMLRPEVVAIGGGVAGAPDALLLEPLRELVNRESYARHGRPVHPSAAGGVGE